MFMHWPGRRSISVDPDRIVAVIESINTPNISVPEAGTQPTKSYIIGAATPTGQFSLYVYLLLLETNHPIVYVSDTPEVSLDEFGNLEAEAIQFAESMGFMLDNMNLRARPPEEQAQILAALPFLHENPALLAVTTGQDEGEYETLAVIEEDAAPALRSQQPLGDFGGLGSLGGLMGAGPAPSSGGQGARSPADAALAARLLASF
jgi:hypothetical protein